jgi:hypothetical protein
LRFTAVDGMTEIGTYPSAWDQGEATAQIQVPIVVFASLDEQGDTIQIIATVEWSVVEPTRRLMMLLSLGVPRPLNILILIILPI